MVLILTIVSLTRLSQATRSPPALFPRGLQGAECFLIKTYGPTSSPSLSFLFFCHLLERGVWLKHLVMFSWRLFLFFLQAFVFLSCSIYLHLPRWLVRLLPAIALDSPLRIPPSLMPLYRPVFRRPSLPSIISFMWLFRRHDSPTTFLGLSTLTTLSYLSVPFLCLLMTSHLVCLKTAYSSPNLISDTSGLRNPHRTFCHYFGISFS